MRESIGTAFLLNFIVIFIVFIMLFLAATLSYYRAYRINNAILNAIEKFEGYNNYSKAEIKNKLSGMGYDVTGIKCAQTRFENNSSNVKGALQNDGSKDGYCIYLYWNENPKNENGKNIYYSYGVETYLRIQIPILNSLLKLPVYSRTYNMYYFPNS